jgi:hypothetical protein
MIIEIWCNQFLDVGKKVEIFVDGLKHTKCCCNHSHARSDSAIPILENYDMKMMDVLLRTFLILT